MKTQNDIIQQSSEIIKQFIDSKCEKRALNKLRQLINKNLSINSIQQILSSPNFLFKRLHLNAFDLLKSEYYNILFNKAKKEFTIDFDDKDVVVINLKNKYLTQLPPININAVVTAPMGIGKTYSIIQRAKAMYKDNKTLVIVCSRLALCEQYRKSLNKSNPYLYFGKNKTFGVGINICTVDQFSKVKLGFKTIKKTIDLIIIEEYQFLIADNKIRKDVNDNFIKELKAFYKNQKTSIHCISATPCSKSLDKLNIPNLKNYIYLSTKPLNKITVAFTDNICSSIECYIIKYLKSRLRVIVNYDNKLECAELILKINRVFNNLKSIQLTNKTIKDFDYDFSKYNLITSTSVIDNGISIEDRVPTVVLTALVSNDGFKMALQKSSRVRWNITKNILIVNSRNVKMFKPKPKPSFKDISRINNILKDQGEWQDENFNDITQKALKSQVVSNFRIDRSVKTTFVNIGMPEFNFIKLNDITYGKSLNYKNDLTALPNNYKNPSNYSNSLQLLQYIDNLDISLLKYAYEDPIFKSVFNNYCSAFGVKCNNFVVLDNYKSDSLICNLFKKQIKQTFSELNPIEIKVILTTIIEQVLSKTENKTFNDYISKIYNIDNIPTLEKILGESLLSIEEGVSKWLVKIHSSIDIINTHSFKDIHSLIDVANNLSKSKVRKSLILSKTMDYCLKDVMLDNKDSLLPIISIIVNIIVKFKQENLLDRIPVTYSIKDIDDFINKNIHMQGRKKDQCQYYAQNLSYNDYLGIAQTVKKVLCLLGVIKIFKDKKVITFTSESIKEIYILRNEFFSKINTIFDSLKKGKLIYEGFTPWLILKYDLIRDLFVYLLNYKSELLNIICINDQEKIIRIPEAMAYLKEFGINVIYSTLVDWIEKYDIGYIENLCYKYINKAKLNKFVGINNLKPTGDKFLSVNQVMKILNKTRETVIIKIKKYNLGYKIGKKYYVIESRLVNYIKQGG